MSLEIYGSNPSYVYQQVSEEGSAAEDAASFNADFDTFVTLLTAQLQYQDPLEPMETSEFTNQLVAYSEVEQAIATNDHLEKLIAIEGANASATAVSYIGKEVLTLGSTVEMTDGSASWDYSLEADAPEVKITVYDSSGDEVYTETAEGESGTNTFEWDGKDNDGNALDEGSYTLGIEAYDEDSLEVAYSVMVAGVVDGVDFSSTTPIITIGDTAFLASDILQVRENESDEESETETDTDTTDTSNDTTDDETQSSS